MIQDNNNNDRIKDSDTSPVGSVSAGDVTSNNKRSHSVYESDDAGVPVSHDIKLKERLERESIGVIKKRDKDLNTNWLYDRYRAATLQRNLMVLLNILALISMLFSTMSATKVIKSKSLDPFVIEVDKKTGIVTLVDQDKVKLFTPDEAVNNFFLVKYLNARELFDTRNYKTFYYKDVRLMSDDKVYKTFLRVLRADNQQNPMSLYAFNVSSSLTVRSLQYLQPDTVQVRFTVEAELPSGRTITKHKIAIIGFKYVPTRLSEEDRYINPLGFLVTSYNSSDEVL